MYMINFFFRNVNKFGEIFCKNFLDFMLGGRIAHIYVLEFVQTMHVCARPAGEKRGQEPSQTPKFSSRPSPP
ncbi:MAG: hypothetical protein J6C52_11045, partial [Clostridia bacterium]|nr:hypothetical protein [Clostridia bacterium]